MSHPKVVTNQVRFSYLNVFEPRAAQEGGPEKYSVTLLIDKGDKETIAKIEAATNKAIQNGLDSHFGGKVPKNLKTPLRDGDEERDSEEFENCMFVNANSTRRPGVVDKDVAPILDPEEIYSGCYGRAAIVFYPYNVNGNRGIACGLNNIQKLKDGPALGGAPASPEADFGAADDDDLL